MTADGTEIGLTNVDFASFGQETAKTMKIPITKCSGPNGKEATIEVSLLGVLVPDDKSPRLDKLTEDTKMGIAYLYKQIDDLHKSSSDWKKATAKES